MSLVLLHWYFTPALLKYHDPIHHLGVQLDHDLVGTACILTISYNDFPLLHLEGSLLERLSPGLGGGLERLSPGLGGGS